MPIRVWIPLVVVFLPCLPGFADDEALPKCSPNNNLFTSTHARVSPTPEKKTALFHACPPFSPGPNSQMLRIGSPHVIILSTNVEEDNMNSAHLRPPPGQLPKPRRAGVWRNPGLEAAILCGQGFRRSSGEL